MEDLFLFKLISLFKFNCNFKEKGEINKLISPFNLLVFNVLISPISFSLNKIFLFPIFIQFILYSRCYYLLLKKEKNMSIWEGIKADIPTFSKIDMKPWHIFLFVIISAPFLLFFGSVILSILD